MVDTSTNSSPARWPWIPEDRQRASTGFSAVAVGPDPGAGCRPAYRYRLGQSAPAPWDSGVALGESGEPTVRAGRENAQRESQPALADPFGSSAPPSSAVPKTPPETKPADPFGPPAPPSSAAPKTPPKPAAKLTATPGGPLPTVANSIGMTFVVIPTGEFEMSSAGHRGEIAL